MDMKYFDLFNDMSIRNRWALNGPVDEHGQKIDPWQFFNGRIIEQQGVPLLPVAHSGVTLDFTTTGLAIPVVHARVVPLFDRLGLQSQVQFLPVRVEGQSEPYFILNTLRIIRCIDDARCEEVQYWKPEDGRPDKTGKYRVVYGLRIDPSKVGDAHIFRPWGWSSTLIVSEQLKQILEEARVSGTRFTEV
jgi:hypothetical protein